MSEGLFTVEVSFHFCEDNLGEIHKPYAKAVVSVVNSCLQEWSNPVSNTSLQFLKLNWNTVCTSEDYIRSHVDTDWCSVMGVTSVAYEKYLLDINFIFVLYNFIHVFCRSD